MGVPGTTAAGTCAPSAARVYDYLLGGRDNSAADRELAQRMADPEQGGYAGLADLARQNRRFILAAVQRLAGIDGFGQFLDLGCGVCPGAPLHQVARGSVPGARVAYVDNDPIVISHMGRLARGGVAVTGGDLTDPEAVLADRRLREVIDLGQPTAVILGASLSFADTGTAQAAVAGYMAALPEGSAAVISLASFDDETLAKRMEAMFTASPWRNHSLRDVESMFGGLRLMRGLVAGVRRWPMLPDGDERPARMIGGVGFKRPAPRALAAADLACAAGARRAAVTARPAPARGSTSRPCCPRRRCEARPAGR
jgi:S-adenosyl methyltransferase